MLKFILHRLLQAVPVLFVIITMTFFLIRLAPGDPFSQERQVSPQIRAAMMAHYGLDRPLAEQYVRYLWSVLPKNLSLAGMYGVTWDELRREEHVGQPVRPWVYFQLDGGKVSALFEDRPGRRAPDLLGFFGIDLGPSSKHEGRSVNEMIAESIPVSFELGVWAIAVALGLGVPAGIVAALRKNTALDYVPMSSSMVGICLPTFVVGPLLALLLGLALGWFNVSGWFGPGDRVLPALTLGLAQAAYIARLTRGGMLEVLSSDFIRTARAKGVPERQIILRHSLRGGLLPVVTYLGPALAGLLSGAFITEMIFQIPGLGRHFINGALNRDYAMILGTVTLFAVLIIIANLAVDVIQVLLNPRLKFE